MPHRITIARLEQLTREARMLEPCIAADPAGQRECEARFRRLRDEAVALCKTLPGAQVAAMQIGAAAFGPQGIARVIGLLGRVRHDVGEVEDHAA